MIIAVASGKGGTGKTTVAVNLAYSSGAKIQLLDCDVEEPNDYIFLRSNNFNFEDVNIKIPEIDRSLCQFCGVCQEACLYNAISVVNNKNNKNNIFVFDSLCHSCGVCSYVCPCCAIKEVDSKVGIVARSNVDHIDFIYGKLNIGAVMAPAVIKYVKSKINRELVTIIDAPPGAACPMVATVHDADYCILVAEPTPFGLNDFKIIYESVKKLNLPCGVIINKADLGDDGLENFCCDNGIEILGKIPFSEEMAYIYSNGGIVSKMDCKYKEYFKSILDKIIGDFK